MRSLHWRQRYWARSQVGFPQFMQARPNAAHEALVDLQSQSRVLGVITQNVDRLHQQAGQRDVIDLHGRLDQVVCMSCAEVTSRHQWQDWLQVHNPDVDDVEHALAPDGDADLAREDFKDVRVPVCESCGGTLKPHVVFFGDSVPKATVERCYQWVDQADAMLVVGSSLMVYSGFRFVRRAQQRELPIAAVNQGKTRADEWFELKVTGNCSDILPQVVSG